MPKPRITPVLPITPVLTKLIAMHEWPIRPIVTLEQDSVWGEVRWPSGSTSHGFNPKVLNSVIVQVAFKYRNPYGGHADFQVVIDEFSGSVWSNVFTDPIHYFTDFSDDKWYTQAKDYRLRVQIGARQLKFRIGVSIEVGGSLPTGGSGSGSTGNWLPITYNEFTASFSTPKPADLETYLKVLDNDWRRSREEFRRRSGNT